jgi:hypothetical protein
MSKGILKVNIFDFGKTLSEERKSGGDERKLGGKWARRSGEREKREEIREKKILMSREKREENLTLNWIDGDMWKNYNCLNDVSSWITAIKYAESWGEASGDIQGLALAFELGLLSFWHRFGRVFVGGIVSLVIEL